MEVYSRGVGEDESGDGLYCGFEGVVGAAVISVQDTPGFKVRDDTLNKVADAIDGRVVSPVGIGEFTIGGFLDRGDHSQPDVAVHLAARAEVSWPNTEMPPSSQSITTLRSPATYSSERLPPMASR